MTKLLGILMGVFLMATALEASAQDDVIKQRQDLMKSNGRASKALRGAAKKKDFAAVETQANVISDNMTKVLDLFPKGSTSDKSRAKADIWTKWDQ